MSTWFDSQDHKKPAALNLPNLTDCDSAQEFPQPDGEFLRGGTEQTHPKERHNTRKALPLLLLPTCLKLAAYRVANNLGLHVDKRLGFTRDLFKQGVIFCVVQ